MQSVWEIEPVLAMEPEENTLSHLKRTLTPSDLIQLQEAATRLRALSEKKEGENQMLTQMLHNYRKEIIRLRSSELLLQKELLMWSSFNRLFVQPLYETRLALGRYQSEEQQLSLQEMIFDREHNNSFLKVKHEKQRRETNNLLTKIRQLKEEKDKNKEEKSKMEVEIMSLKKDYRDVQKQSSILQDELKYCMNRLEESERGYAQVQRNLSAHQAALLKKRDDIINIKWYEEEIHSRDEVIQQLQRTVRELNKRIGQQCSQEIELNITPTIKNVNNGSFSEKLHLSIQKLRNQLENNMETPIQRHSLFSFQQNNNTPSNVQALSYSSSSWTPDRDDSVGININSNNIDLEEFLYQELRSTFP